jgi:hypothetical protein
MSDEPRIAKYGLPAHDSQRFHANHFVVMQERARLRDLLFQHALRVGPGLRAALDGLAGRGAALVTVPNGAAPAPEPAPSAPPSSPMSARRAVPDGLRERLGLR